MPRLHFLQTLERSGFCPRMLRAENRQGPCSRLSLPWGGLGTGGRQGPTGSDHSIAQHRRQVWAHRQMRPQASDPAARSPRPVHPTEDDRTGAGKASTWTECHGICDTRVFSGDCGNMEEGDKTGA